jgi:ABC-type polar amino acid transport system ATPase subunit
MDKKSINSKEQGKQVINRIFAVFKSWELFSDEQIVDAITAL